MTLMRLVQRPRWLVMIEVMDSQIGNAYPKGLRTQKEVIVCGT